VYVATQNRTECRQFIDTVNATTPAIVTAAKKLAGVLNLDHADDEEMRNVAWNVKFALEGGNEQ
jgi:hypothetical protein